MPVLLATAVIVTTAAGAFAQRVSGLGFSLIAAPSLALAVGAHDGIALVNLLAIVVAASVFAPSVRNVDKAKAAILVPAGLAGVVPGAIVFQLLPADSLQIAVGAVTGLGLIAVSVTSRLHAAPSLPVTAAAGLTSGFTTAVGGAGGPALTVYAVATRWPQAQFAATAQILFALQAAAALGFKGVPHLPLSWLGATIAAALAGLACGQLLAHRVNPDSARRVAIVVAALASVVTVIHGILA
jgi:uncharacterized membrane protein YfcA